MGIPRVADTQTRAIWEAWDLIPFPLRRGRGTTALRLGKVGVPIVAQWVKNPTSIYEDVGLIPGLVQWVRIWCFHKLRDKIQLGSFDAMAVA